MAFNHTFMLNAHDFVTTWISYKLRLRDPSIALQTACSTGLVAVATACQNLLDYSCDTALAVSASIFSPRSWGYWAESGGILSPDDHCRPFDSRANGTIMGEGVCALLLKRFQDALRDGDRIHGLIRGFAVNNDNPDKAGKQIDCLEERMNGYLNLYERPVEILDSIPGIDLITA